MISFPLVAQFEFLGTTAGLLATIIVLALMACLTVFAMVLKYYKRCPSNRVLVVYGKTRRDEPADCISGGARLVVPLIQD